MTVAPPANGKKLWRVKRTLSAPAACSSTQSQSSLECLNNSLKIANAARFTVKRPPLRRPKNKPGQAKDFVFVDLSPVTADASSPDQSPIEPSPKEEEIFDVPYDESMFNTSLFDTSFSNYVTDAVLPASSVESDCLGLGIMGVDFNQQQLFHAQPTQPAPEPQVAPVEPMDAATLNKQLEDYQRAMLEQHQQIQYLQQQLQKQQTASPITMPKVRKPKTTKRKSLGQFQFKTYTGPKKAKTEKASVDASEPKSAVDLDDFFVLNDQLGVSSLDNRNDFGAGIDQFLMPRPEELYTGFV